MAKPPGNGPAWQKWIFDSNDLRTGGFTLRVSEAETI